MKEKNMYNEKAGRYDDIIDMPHHVSKTRPRMASADRAAQFSPFAALTGYEAVVEEAARLTETKSELTDDQKALLDEKLRMIAEHIDKAPLLTIKYFLPDAKKAGGAYLDVHGTVKHIDAIEHTVIMSDKTRIPIENIRSIEGTLFRGYDI